MRISSALFSIAALLAGVPATHAQTQALPYGRETLTFTPALLGVLSAAGATLTDLNGIPLVGGAANFTTVGGSTVRVQDTIEDASGPSGTTTALFIVNGRLLGRQLLFVALGGPTSQPIIANGTISAAGASLGFAPAYISLINQALGRQALTATTPIATASTYMVTVPLGPGGN